MNMVNTLFEQSILVDLEDVDNCPQTLDMKCFVYLPKRWAEIFTEEQPRAVQSCELSLKVTGHTS